MSCYRKHFLVYTTMLNRNVLYFTAGFDTLCTAAVYRGIPTKNPGVMTCKKPIVNVDGSRHVLLPKGLHHAETV